MANDGPRPSDSYNTLGELAPDLPSSDFESDEALPSPLPLPLYEWFPARPLWQPPLANQREPRMLLKLHALEDRTALDAAAGDYIPMVRQCAPPPFDEGEIDVFGVVFLRIFDFEDVYACDGRAGLAYSWRQDCWTGKFACEHTSCHLVDEFVVNTGQILSTNYARDEVTAALAYGEVEQWRWYGQIGVPWVRRSFNTFENTRIASGFRCFTGAEVYFPAIATDLGKPYLALDIDLRDEQDYQPNITVQVGWRMFAGCCRNPFFAVEYYHGKSPYGQFLLNNESWVALTVAIDR